MFEIPNFTPAIPEFFLLLMTAVVLLVHLFIDERFQVVTYYLSQATLLGTAALTIGLFPHATEITFNGNFVLDPVASLLKIFIYISTFLVFLYSRDYVSNRSGPFGEFFILGLFSVLGMMVLMSANNFITLFMGLELFSLPIYAIVALQRDSVIAPEAAMKYFVMGAVASGMLLYGMSMLYGATKALEIPVIAQAITAMPAQQNLILIFGLVFVVAGIAFKLGAVPFHMWVPDVYEGSPSAATLFISAAPKIAGFGLAIRLLIHTLPLLHFEWQHMLMIVAILSMALGNFAAIAQTNIKRMLAYSSIAHMGYMSLGLISGTEMGYGASTFYIFSYALMSLGAFGMVVLLSKTGFEAENIEDFRGLNARNSWLALMMLIVMFSMAGMPLTIGFFAKMSVLEALVHVNLVWLAALALAFAVVGAYYYLRVVKVMYFDDPIEQSVVLAPSADMNFAISVNCLALVVLGLMPMQLFALCQAVF